MSPIPKDTSGIHAPTNHDDTRRREYGMAVTSSTLPWRCRAIALALSIVLFDEHPEDSLTTAQVAAGVSLTPRTVRRHLRTLEQGGWVTRDADGRWMPAEDHPKASRARSGGVA